MVINRFHKFPQYDFGMKHYAPETFVPNFEAWDSMLAAQQTKYDTALSLKNKHPKYLPNREDLASQYINEADANVTNITDQYLKNGVTGGNRAIRDYGLKLNKDWQPGGVAYELENEYNDYVKASGEIDKYYKDNKAENSANRDYSLHKLRESVNQPMEKNPVTGLYTRRGISPEIIPYVDISDEALKIVKEIKDSGRTDIVAMNPYWFQKITTEGVTKETVKAVTDALLAQPKYQQQQQVELWKMKQGLPPERQQEIVDASKRSTLENVNNNLKQIQTLASSNNKADIMDLQKQLANEGLYDGKIDGDFGKKSKEALDEYVNKTKEEAKNKAENISIDSILSQQLKNNYATPLIRAFSREKVDKDLVFNQETALKAKLASQRNETAKLISAMQSLRDPETSDYLVTPGKASVAESIDKLKSGADETINAAKKTFGTIVKSSELSTLVGSADPNMINEITQLRIQSRTPEEFTNKLMMSGFVTIDANKASKIYDFYNSPAAGNLNNAYLAMNEANAQKESIIKAEYSLNEQYANSPEGKQEVKRIRKETGFTGSDDELLKLITTRDKKLIKPGTKLITNINPYDKGIETTVDFGAGFAGKSMDYHKKNNTELPQSLRGYTINASGGYGKKVESLIKDDLQTGYTLGYTGLNFTKIGTDDSVDKKDLNLDKTDIKINVTGDKITYYMTGKTNNSKNPELVTGSADAPSEHYDKLRVLSLDMKKQAVETKDASLDALANNLYRITTGGSALENAYDDPVIVNSKNGDKLSDVIDPTRSKKGDIITFKNNENVIGMPIGREKEVDGKTFKKFKVTNPKTGGQAYIQTVKTTSRDKKGNLQEQYLPVSNKQGGLYYDSSLEADNVIIDLQMMREIPVNVNQQKVSNTNLTDEEQIQLMLGVQSQNRDDG
jgi:hypothetical protein